MDCGSLGRPATVSTKFFAMSGSTGKIRFPLDRSTLRSTFRKITFSLTMRKTEQRTFHRFPQLPAELRVQVWAFALQQDSRNVPRRNISIYQHKDLPRVNISKRYPRTFAVNRESRYETSRLLGGEWIQLNGGTETRKTKSQAYINFDTDFVLLRGFQDLFDQMEMTLTWNGHEAVVWNYCRNLDSPDPIYVVGAQKAQGKLWDC